MTTTSETTAPPAGADLGGGLSRRALIKQGTSAAAALGLGALWARPALAGGVGPGTLVPRSDILMLVNRVTNGQTEAELRRANALGYAGYLQDALNPPPGLQDTAADAFIAPFLLWLDATPYDFAVALGPPPVQPSFTQAIAVLQQATIGRALFSKRQLLERTVEFFTDHLNVYGKQPGQEFVKPWDDKHVVRANALGSFKQLIRDSSKSTSMLTYLNQVTSSQPAVNENYARELCELHTIAPEDPCTGAQNYSESDVLAAAKALSGFSVDLAANPLTTNWGLFKFVPAFHSLDPKTFLGVDLTLDAVNPSEGEQVIELLVNNAAAARFLAWKLIRWFLRYDPPCQLVDQLELIYAANDGALKPMIAAVLAQPNIAALSSGPAPTLKLRRPRQFVLAAMRAVRLQMSNVAPGPMAELQAMNNAPFEWPAPDGYPDEADKWAGAVFSRWLFANKLLAAPGSPDEMVGASLTGAELTALLGSYATPAELVARIDSILTGGVLSANEKSVLEAYIVDAGTAGLPAEQIERESLALGVSSPTFQYY